MEINKKTIRKLSLLGHRGTFSKAMLDAADEGEDIAVLTADLAALTGLTQFAANYPQRFFNMGIAEQNMIGVAAGLSRFYQNVYATTYANFLTMRAYEQIRMNLGYMKHKVCLVGTGAGLSMGVSGNSHLGLEDLSLMRSVPNMTVVSPADCLEEYKILRQIRFLESPVYIRLTGGLNSPMLYTADYEYQFGKAIDLTEGTDLCIIGIGTLLGACKKAADELKKEGMTVQLVNMHTLKPLDTQKLDTLFLRHTKIITIEEHSLTGGLGTAVMEYAMEYGYRGRIHKIALPDQFLVAGDESFLADYYQLSAEKLKNQVLELCKK